MYIIGELCSRVQGGIAEISANAERRSGPTAIAASWNQQFLNGTRCARKDYAVRSGLPNMTLMIESSSDERGRTVRLTGDLRGENLPELEAVLAERGPAVMVDLAEVRLVDIAAIQFLAGCRKRGVPLLHCSPYIESWIAGEESHPGGEADRETET